jgi:hypothetical protein
MAPLNRKTADDAQGISARPQIKVLSPGVWHLHTSQKVLIALIGLMGTLDSAFAVPPTLNSSGLTPEQCYRRDSDCTWACGEATGDLKYECFGICDRMLGHCLDTGDWTDSELQIDPGTGKPPDKGSLLAGLLMRMMIILADTDGDGVLSPKEIRSLKERVFIRADTNDSSKPPVNPDKQ